MKGSKAVRLLVLIVSLGACSSSNIHAPRQLIVPIECFNTIVNRSAIQDMSKQSINTGQGTLCWIHYDDETLCGTCLLQQYYIWDDIIERLGSKEKMVRIFILESNESHSIDELQASLDEFYFSEPVYVDLEHLFRDENHIETMSGSADFLVDSLGYVILAGDIRNDSSFIEKMKMALVERDRFNENRGRCNLVPFPDIVKGISR